MLQRPSIFFRPNSTGRQGPRDRTKLAGDLFSKERALLLLDIPWAMIEGLQTDRELPPREK